MKGLCKSQGLCNSSAMYCGHPLELSVDYTMAIFLEKLWGKFEQSSLEEGSQPRRVCWTGRQTSIVVYISTERHDCILGMSIAFPFAFPRFRIFTIHLRADSNYMSGWGVGLYVKIRGNGGARQPEVVPAPDGWLSGRRNAWGWIDGHGVRAWVCPSWALLNGEEWSKLKAHQLYESFSLATSDQYIIAEAKHPGYLELCQLG